MWRALRAAAMAGGILLAPVLPMGGAVAAQQAACAAAGISPPALGRPLDAVRVAELLAQAGSPPPGDPLRRGSGDLTLASCPGTGVSGGLSLLRARASMEYRSAYPSDANNGALWAGRGVSAAVTGGVRAGWGPLEVVLAPTAAWQENAVVVTASGPGSFRYPYNSIDWPQRFGSGPYTTVDWGQSALSVTAGPVEVRLASENLWWGPARRYPILLSNTAAGFPHLAVMTDEPLWVGVGYLSGRVMWGRLDESGYFDELPENDARLLSGAFVELAPLVLPGLTLGAGVFYHLPWEDVVSHALDIFTFAIEEQEGSAGNALASLTARWVQPESRFEAYVEWAREDYWLNMEDFVTEPDHSQGYTLGFAKLFDFGGTYLLQGELTHLQSAPTWQTGRSFGKPTFFVHSGLRQGHTHLGQLLGSSIGPGADAQFLAVSRIGAERSFGLFAERVRRAEDVYYTRFGHLYGFRGHDVEWTLGANGAEQLGAMVVGWTAAVSRRKNRNFIGLDGRDWDFLRETNATLRLDLSWAPGEHLAASAQQDADGGGR